MDTPAPIFGELDPPLDDYARAAAVVLPVPFERTTSYGQGTAHGPRAILEASQYVELYDEELDAEPSDHGIATLPACDPSDGDLATALGVIEAEARRHLEAGKFLVTLGGEHSLTLAPVRAARALAPDLGVVQFDAHADLRDTYEGSPYSHASVMHRLLDLDIPSLAVGIRSLSSPEAALIREHDIPVIWGHQLDEAEARFDALLDRLPHTVYLTFDLDFFDPSLLPATGTPEPGGGFWNPTQRLLRRLFERKRVLAMDVVELAPIAGQYASDFIAAKLVYKCIGYHTLTLD